VQLLDAMREHRGVSYLRTTREAMPVLYGADQTFEIGGSHTVRSSDGDAITLIGAGITLRECLSAVDTLAERGIAARVIDLYSVKPVDAETVVKAARETDAIITVEDHWAEGGIGETVAGVLAEAGAETRLTRLAVSGRPGSGPPADLLAAAGIDAEHIVTAAERALQSAQA
jgi:transketolase